MSTEFDIVIAGGGIAGLTAGLTAARLGRKTLVLTGHVLGGNLLSIEKIEGYPGFPEGVPGYELCPLAQSQAAEAGAEFEPVPLLRVEGDAPALRLTTTEGELTARALIVATGCDMKALGLPGEERLKGKGVSHCASCDGPLLRGQAVAVIGGGDSGMQEALTLAAHASRVILLQRGEALSGQAAYRERVLAEPRIEVRYGTQVDEILGEDAVTGLRISDGSGSAALEVAAVFAYVGFAPNTAFLDGFVGLDAAGRVPTDGALATRRPGVFAAGSVRAGWAGRAVASAGEGTAAALAAHAFLS